MKRIMALSICFLLLFSLPVMAADEVTVVLSGEVLEFDVPPQIIGDRTMVPMRKIFESLGASVQWVADGQLILAAYQTNIIAMRVGEMSFTVTDVLTNETQTVELDVPPQIVNDRTLVPVRAISESLQKKVSWDGETRTVTID